MDLEGITLREMSQRQVVYNITYAWNLKYTSEYNKKEADSHIQRTSEWLRVGRGAWGRARQGLWIKRGCLPRIKQMSHRNSVCVTGNIASILRQL